MRTASLLVLCSSLAAQNYLYLPATANPANTELSNYAMSPLMTTDAKAQFFFSAAEAGAAFFAATELALRFDGPIPQVGAPGPFVIQRLTIDVGVSTVGRPESRFAANLTTPLLTVFDQGISFLPDQGSKTPDDWGGTNNTLVFPFSAPAGIAIPPGGWFVVQITVRGNANNGLAHAMLDAKKIASLANGSATSSGLGCAADPQAPNATILSQGTYAPGCAHSLYGAGLGANSAVLTMLGASDQNFGGLTLPFLLPGTGCSAYCSFDLALPQVADATGAIAAQTASSFVGVPPEPAFNGAAFFAQHVALVPAANQYGVVLSDKRTIQLGSYAPPQNGIWYVSNSASANASHATVADALGLALRVKTN